jgi:autotransporter-associated beta strand protein
VPTRNGTSAGKSARTTPTKGVFVREIVEANGTTPAGAAAIGSFAMNGNLTKTGTGQLVLAATTVSGAGNFIVNQGALKLNAGASRLLSVGGSGNITINNDAQLFISRNSGTMSITRDIVLNNTAGMVWGGGGGANDSQVASNIAWNGSAHTLNLPVANRYESTGAWTGTATVNRTGTSNLTLSGDLSGFTGTLNLQGGTTSLTGAGAFGGNLDLATGAVLNGEITVTGNLGLAGGQFSANPLTAASLGTLGDLTLSGTSIVALAANPASPAPFTVLTYGGTLTGGAANLDLLGGSANYRSPTFDDSTLGIITLAVGSENRTWNGGANWDINTSNNWQEGDFRFFQVDNVTFTDTGAGSVALTGDLAPASITINNSAGNDYTFTAAAGTNRISGSTGIVKSGAGNVTLGGANTFSGGVAINGGTLRITNNQALGANGNLITIAAGGALDLNGAQNASRDYQAVIAGSGIGGTGAIVNSSGSLNSGLGSITLAGDAAIGSATSARWDLRPITAGTGVLDIGGNTLTKTGPGIVALVDSVFTSGGTIQINEGELRYTRNSTGATTGQVALAANTILTFENQSAGDFGWDLAVDNATVRNLGTPLVTLPSNVALTNTATFEINPAVFTLAGDLSGTGTLVKTGTQALVLTGDASHSGGTTITAGTLQIGDGGTSGTIGGAIDNAATLVFNRSDDSSFGGAIGGTGAIQKAGAGTLAVSGANSLHRHPLDQRRHDPPRRRRRPPRHGLFCHPRRQRRRHPRPQRLQPGTARPHRRRRHRRHGRQFRRRPVGPDPPPRRRRQQHVRRRARRRHPPRGGRQQGGPLVRRPAPAPRRRRQHVHRRDPGRRRHPDGAPRRLARRRARGLRAGLHHPPKQRRPAQRGRCQPARNPRQPRHHPRNRRRRPGRRLQPERVRPQRHRRRGRQPPDNYAEQRHHGLHRCQHLRRRHDHPGHRPQRHRPPANRRRRHFRQPRHWQRAERWRADLQPQRRLRLHRRHFRRRHPHPGGPAPPPSAAPIPTPARPPSPPAPSRWPAAAASAPPP